MNIDTLKNQIRYLTNQEGKTTDVLIPLTIWESIIEKLNPKTTEENDSKAQLIADLKGVEPRYARNRTPMSINHDIYS